VADTVIGTSDPQAVKRWSVDLMRESLGKMKLRGAMGRSNDSFIKIHMDLDKDAGDDVKFDLREQDRSAGVSGETALEGAESAMVFWQDSVTINLKRNAHVFTTMSQQRTVHDLRREARDNMSNWFSWGLEAGLLAHFAGTTGDSTETSEPFLFQTSFGTPQAGGDVFGNTVAANDASRIVGPGTASLSVGLIEDAVATAKTINPMIPKGKIDGGYYYLLLAHPYSVRSLRQTIDNSGTAGWLDSQRQASVRGESNPIWIDADSMYAGCIIVENEFVPYDVTTDTAYNVLLGACGGSIAFGNAWNRMSSVRSATGGSAFSMIEDTDDYGNRTGYGVGSMTGFKRTEFNSLSYACLTVPTNEPPPA